MMKNCDVIIIRFKHLGTVMDEEPEHVPALFIVMYAQGDHEGGPSIVQLVIDIDPLVKQGFYLAVAQTDNRFGQPLGHRLK